MDLIHCGVGGISWSDEQLPASRRKLQSEQYSYFLIVGGGGEGGRNQKPEFCDVTSNKYVIFMT